MDERSIFDNPANVKTVELLSIDNAREISGCKVIAVRTLLDFGRDNSILKSVQWPCLLIWPRRTTGYCPCGGDGIDSDCTVTALLVMLYVVPTPFQIFSEKKANVPYC